MNKLRLATERNGPQISGIVKGNSANWCVFKSVSLTDVVMQSQMWKCFFSELDACAQGHDCQHICANSDDSYICMCQVGYVLNADRKTCSRKNLIYLNMHICLGCDPAFQILLKAPNLDLQSTVHQSTKALESRRYRDWDYWKVLVPWLRKPLLLKGTGIKRSAKA